MIGRAFTPELDTRHWGARATLGYDGDLFDVEYTASYRDLVYNYEAATPLSPYYDGVIADLTGPGGINETLDNFSRFQSITDSQSKTHELRFFDNEVLEMFSKVRPGVPLGSICCLCVECGK